MGAAYFYHLTSASLEQTLPMLLGKAMGAGWRIEVRGRDAARMAGLDAALWTGADDSFLPHGLAGGAHDADQPILLTTHEQTTGQAANGAVCVMAVNGADVTADEADALDRTCIIFDGHDGEALAHARTQWKALTDAGVAAQYWSQESGRWEKKAEKNA